MDRTSELWKLAKELLTPRLAGNIQEMARHLRLHRSDVYQEIAGVVDGLIKKTVEQQKEDKGPVRYLAFSFMMSSVIIRTYELQTAFYDELFYLDPVESCCYWSPEFIYRYIDGDIEYLAQKMRGKIVRLKDYEVDDIRRKYVIEYNEIAKHFLSVCVMDAVQRADFRPLRMEKETEVVIGGYMDQAAIIGLIKRGEGDEILFDAVGPSI